MDKRGALLATNPEEMMHAILAVIARDIEVGSPVKGLGLWRAQVLSCTGAFVVHNEAAGLMRQWSSGRIWPYTTKR